MSGALFLLLAVAKIDAQAEPSVDSVKTERVYVRARQLVNDGEGEKGRAIIDSMLNATTPGSPEHGEALYWHAVLALTGTIAEHDYKELLIDYPTSPRIEDALLRLAQLEIARDDFDGATTHLQRLILEYPNGEARTRASYWLAHVLLSKNEPAKACAVNADAMARVKPSEIELKNQIEYQAKRCATIAAANPVSQPASTPPSATAGAASSSGSTTTMAAVTDTGKHRTSERGTAGKSPDSAGGAAADKESVGHTPPVEKSKGKMVSKEGIASMGGKKERRSAMKHPALKDTVAAQQVERVAETESPAKAKPIKSREVVKQSDTPKVAPTEKAVPAEKKVAPHIEETSGAYFVIQVGAYTDRRHADAFAGQMRAKGYDVSVDTEGAPYRVRLGHYATHKEAVQTLAVLRKKSLRGFIVQVEGR